MKYCPQCRTAYTDDTLRFCLQDGTPLADAPDANFDLPTVALDDSATLVSRKPPQQVVRINAAETEADNRRQTDSTRQTWEQTDPAAISAAPIEAKKSNTAFIVLATVLGMFLIFGVIGGAWALLKSRKPTVTAVNINAAPINRPVNANAANVQNANINANISTPSPVPSPSPTITSTPSPRPALRPEEFKAVTNDVKDAIDNWKNSSEDLDIDGNLSQYAETVDYYAGGKTTRARVRADKIRAFEQYDSIDFDISNVKITPDASGETATAVFDKEWRFEGSEKFSSGKVQQQLTFGKINGRWPITGEKDLKTYYTQK